MAKRHSFETCMEKLIALVNGEEFLKMARSSSVDFTRNRKMGFASYIWYFLLHCTRSLSTGLHAFQQAFRENDDVITKQGFSKGRRRIRPEAIAYLVDFTRDQFYKTAEAQLWNGYRLLAIDGSKVNLPTAPELVEHFGCQKESGGQVQALASCLYDVLNGIVVHGLFEPVLRSERDLASEHLRALVQMEQGQETVSNVVLFDRGYPSAHLIEELENAGLKYAMRCSSEFLRSVRYSGNDCIVTHQFLAIRRPMRLRIVQVILNNGETEYIVTNLFDKGLTVKDFQQLYHFRWGIETNYNTMKHKLRMEDFTGHTVDAVLQDFYATLTSVNLLACIIHDNLKEIEEKQKDSGNKYPYIQNINQTIGMMRNRLLEIVAAKSPRRRNMLYRKLLAETRRNLVPVRSGRSFPRGVRHKSAHYSHNTKQA